MVSLKFWLLVVCTVLLSVSVTLGSITTAKDSYRKRSIGCGGLCRPPSATAHRQHRHARRIAAFILTSALASGAQEYQ